MDIESSPTAPLDPQRPLTADEVDAITLHPSFQPMRPSDISKAAWQAELIRAIGEVRKAARILQLNVPIASGRSTSIKRTCDAITKIAQQNPDIDQRLLTDSAVIAVRQEIAVFLSIRVLFARHPQFRDLIKYIRSNGKIDGAIGNIIGNINTFVYSRSNPVQRPADYLVRRANLRRIINEFMAEQTRLPHVDCWSFKRFRYTYSDPEPDEPLPQPAPPAPSISQSPKVPPSLILNPPLPPAVPASAVPAIKQPEKKATKLCPIRTFSSLKKLASQKISILMHTTSLYPKCRETLTKRGFQLTGAILKLQTSLSADPRDIELKDDQGHTLTIRPDDEIECFRLFSLVQE